jgi:hypothetical protein
MPGINRANHFNASGLESSISNKGGICIFLSHRSTDKPDVRDIQDRIKQIGEFIMECEIDIYLDENDEKLQEAVQSNNQIAVTNFIEQGINNSTHLMCIISNNTQGSWWIPYEVGYAKKSFGSDKLATLKLDRGCYLPDYLAITEELKGAQDLYGYLDSIRGQGRLYSGRDFSGYSEESHPLMNCLQWN